MLSQMYLLLRMCLAIAKNGKHTLAILWGWKSYLMTAAKHEIILSERFMAAHSSPNTRIPLTVIIVLPNSWELRSLSISPIFICLFVCLLLFYFQTFKLCVCVCDNLVNVFLSFLPYVVGSGESNSGHQDSDARWPIFALWSWILDIEFIYIFWRLAVILMTSA